MLLSQLFFIWAGDISRAPPFGKLEYLRAELTFQLIFNKTNLANFPWLWFGATPLSSLSTTLLLICWIYFLPFALQTRKRWSQWWWSDRWRWWSFQDTVRGFCYWLIQIVQVHVPLTLSRVGGGRSAPPVTYLRIRDCIYIYTRQFFLTIPHFECGRGDSTFHSIKLHHFPRKI